MGKQNDKWIYDSRGQRVPLRHDPEGVWHHQKSFRPNFTTGNRLIKKHPRIAVVMAMRELTELDFRPQSRGGWFWACVCLIGLSMVYSAMIYGLFLKVFFSTTNWVAILVTFAVVSVIQTLSTWHGWGKADRRLEEIYAIIKAHPSHCAACWYPLGDIYDSDGCVVCPECGGAWSLKGIRDS